MRWTRSAPRRDCVLLSSKAAAGISRPAPVSNGSKRAGTPPRRRRDALQQTKSDGLASAFAALDEPAFAALVEAHAAKRQSSEAAEGLASFAEKRAARWA